MPIDPVPCSAEILTDDGFTRCLNVAVVAIGSAHFCQDCTPKALRALADDKALEAAQ